MRLNIIKERAMQGVFFLTALTSIAAVALICIFLFSNGIPAIAEIRQKTITLGSEKRSL